MEKKEKKERIPARRKIPKEPSERVLLYGVHPEDPREPKQVYIFWASNKLIKQYPCAGDLVHVPVINKATGKIGGTTKVYIVDVKQWEEGDFEPTAIASHLYCGEKYRDFEYEIE